MVRKVLLAAVAVGLFPGCKDPEQKIAERQRALEAARAQEKESQALAEKAKDAPKERAADPYWDDPSFVVIRDEKACPDGMWALFDGPAPAGDDATRQQNAARRGEIAKQLREKTFVARLRGPDQVTLKDYDAPKGEFPLELKGTIDCEDSIGRIAFSFTEAKAVPMPASALSDGPNPQMMWSAPAKDFALPMKSMSEAKAFRDRHRFGLEAYIVFRIGKTEFHHKRVKTAKQTQGEVTIGGTIDDFGAGRLVRADIEGIRVLANPGPIVLVDTRNPSTVSLR